jgi:uncharacterized damage-inducible protein DinB
MKDQFFADYLQRLEDLQHRLHKDVRDLPAEAMDWSPGPQMNSVAVLLAHIASVLHEGIGIALDDPPGRVREQEFQTRGVLSAEMLRRLDAVIDYARGALPRLSLEDLSKERKDEDGTVSCGWALLHALEHAYLHLGHLQWPSTVSLPDVEAEGEVEGSGTRSSAHLARIQKAIPIFHGRNESTSEKSLVQLGGSHHQPLVKPIPRKQ